MPAQKRKHINFFGDSTKFIFFKLIKENFDKVIQLNFGTILSILSQVWKAVILD